MQEPPSSIGPVESWLVRGRGFVGFVKGCHHPLPRLFFTPRLVGGAKLWSPWRSLDLLRSLPGITVEKEPCLGGREAATLDPMRVELVAPWDSLRRLSGCGSRTCRAALELLELLGAPDTAGVTGGLAYDPEHAGDVDLVVYGVSAAERVYRALRDLREEGVTGPLRTPGHEWSREDVGLGEVIAEERVLLGTYNGVEYNVRLVHCLAPSRCWGVRLRGRMRLRARVCGGLAYTTPALYVLCGRQRLFMLTYRLRYTEIPFGSTVEVEGHLEEHCGGGLFLVPDSGGFVRIIGKPPH